LTDRPGKSGVSTGVALFVNNQLADHAHDKRTRIPMGGLRRITAGIFPPMACSILKIQAKVKSFRGGLPASHHGSGRPVSDH